MTSSLRRPPVLMLHGQPGSAADWDAVTAALGDRADAIALDRPGWDGHSKPRDLAGNADAALAALDERGITRATVVGHSLGAAVAAWLAVAHPERVAALVLAAPAANLASIGRFDHWLGLPGVGRLTSDATLTGAGLALSAGAVRRRLARETALEDGYLRACGRALMTPWARRAFHAEQRSLLRDLGSLEHRLAALRAPAWIVSGSEDRIVAHAAARALAEQIEGARLVVMPGAGHLLVQLHSRRLADVIVAALRQVATQ